jgi:hypothetical protein
VPATGRRVRQQNKATTWYDGLKIAISGLAAILDLQVAASSTNKDAFENMTAVERELVASYRNERDSKSSPIEN